MPSLPFRHSAGFGRRVEYLLISRMLMEGLDVYVPLVDDFGIDAIIRKKNGKFIECQIKARSNSVKFGDGALFAAISHPVVRPDYYFVFYAERLDMMWIMSSEQLIATSHQNKKGKNAGLRSIWFNGIRRCSGKEGREEYCKPQHEKYLATDFSIFRDVGAMTVEGTAMEPPKLIGAS